MSLILSCKERRDQNICTNQKIQNKRVFAYWDLYTNNLEKGMATHPSILAWRIPWTEEPRGLQSMGSKRVRHHRMTNIHTQITKMRWFGCCCFPLPELWMLMGNKRKRNNCKDILIERLQAFSTWSWNLESLKTTLIKVSYYCIL